SRGPRRMEAGGRKKFVVKPFRSNMSMDVTKAKEIWQSLRRAIQEIHSHNASALSFEELYRNSYNMVLHKHGEMLYAGVVECITEHLKELAEMVIKATDDSLLDELHKTWTDHTVTMTMIRDILMYMDRTYVPGKRKVPIYDMGQLLFRDLIARHPDVKDRLRWILLQNIENERNGELIDREVMKGVLSMLVDLGLHTNTVYEEDFENEFLRTTAEFYNAEAQRLLDQNTCPDFMQKADKRLTEEHNRVLQYLNSSTETKLKAIVERELIENHAKALVDMEGSGCIAMFRNDRIDDLRRMYILFRRAPAVALEEIGTCASDYIKNTGLDLIQTQMNQQQSSESAVQFVQAVLLLKDKFAMFLVECWADDKAFYKCIQRGFESFLNTTRSCAYMLAQFLDDLLKSKSRYDNDLELQVDKVIGLFRFLSDKDVFEDFYKRLLSKRLLNAKGSSDEAEKMVISKLKAECGYQFTSKLEGMFKDMAMTKDLMDGFKKHSQTLHVQVLTMGYWPTENCSSTALVVPTEIRQWISRFEAFYLTRHNGRKLTWLYNMGTADIKAAFGFESTMQRHELTVSTYQMCLLMLFNDEREAWSYRDIAAATCMGTNDLKRHLISLCTPKFRILIKSSKGKGIDDDDTFSVNHEYKSKLHKVRIPLVSIKDNSSDGTTQVSGLRDELPATVEEDRKHLIEAAIVRIMKTRKKSANVTSFDWQRVSLPFTMSLVRRLIVGHVSKMEMYLQFIGVYVPEKMQEYMEFLPQVVTYSFVYIMLQALAILWGFLFNVGSLLGENVIAIAAMPWPQALSVLFVHYSVIGIVLSIGRTTWILTWQSVENFPYIRRVMRYEASPQIVVFLCALPILLLLTSLIVVPSVCTNLDTSQLVNTTICKTSYLRYLTPQYPVFQRSLRLTTIIASWQFVQVVLEIIPRWKVILSDASLLNIIVLGLSLLGLNGLTILWAIEWCLRHFHIKITSFSDLPPLRWETTGLVLLCLWILWFLTIVCHSFPHGYPSTDDTYLASFFSRIKLSFIIGQVIIFTRACIHPQMGFVHAQLELTIINLLLPLIYVFSLICLRGLALSSWRSVLVSVPISVGTAYILYYLSDINHPHIFIVLALFLYGSLLRWLQRSSASIGRRVSFSSEDQVKHIKPRTYQRVAFRFLLAGSSILALYILFLSGFGALTFLQRQSEWFPDAATLAISPTQIDIQHARVVKLKLGLVQEDAPPVVPMPPYYASCGNRWNNLSLVDYALMSQAAYFNPTGKDLSLFLESVFPPTKDNKPMFDVRIPDNYTQHGSKVEFFEAYSSKLNLSVISVRGTDVGRFRDLIEDVKMFAEPVIFAIISSIFPTIRIWPDVTFSTLIELYHEMMSLFGLSHEYWYYHELMHYVQSIDDRNVILTGHSLGGGIARVVGSILGKPSVSFSPPGSVQTYGKLVHDIAGEDSVVDRRRLHHLSTCVIPEYDPITMIDTQSGLIQRITCDSSHLSMQLSCHMNEGTLCNLVQHCGDHRGRFSTCSFEHRVSTISEDLFEMIFVDLIAPTTLSGIMIAVAILFSVIRYKYIRQRLLRMKQ
ncbi:transmembrane protein, partial [Thraustotheca clavata]